MEREAKLGFTQSVSISWLSYRGALSQWLPWWCGDLNIQMLARFAESFENFPESQSRVLSSSTRIFVFICVYEVVCYASSLRVTSRDLSLEYYLLNLIPSRDSRFFFSPQGPDQLWGQPSLICNGYEGLFPQGWSGRDMKLVAHLYLVLRLQMVER